MTVRGGRPIAILARFDDGLLRQAGKDIARLIECAPGVRIVQIYCIRSTTGLCEVDDSNGNALIGSPLFDEFVVELGFGGILRNLFVGMLTCRHRYPQGLDVFVACGKL
jgi:hypothetical protein